MLQILFPDGVSSNTDCKSFISFAEKSAGAAPSKSIAKYISACFRGSNHSKTSSLKTDFVDMAMDMEKRCLKY